MAKYIDLPNLKENLTNFLNKKINPIYAKKTEIPSNVSELNNDKSYQTAEEVSQAITDGVAKIVAGAPEDFDTLKEMSDWISSHETSAAAMNSAISDNSVAIANHTSNSDIHVTKEEKTKWNKLDSDLKDGTIIVAEATKATQDAQGNVINETYAKKTEVPHGTVVDDALSSTSVNPVQNKVVKAEFDQVNSNLDDLQYSDVAGGKNLFDGKFINRVIDIGNNYTQRNLKEEFGLINNLNGIIYSTFGGYFKKGTYTFSYTNDAWLSLNRIAIAGTNCIDATQSIRKSYTWTQNVDGWTYFGIEGDDKETGTVDTPFSITPDIMIEKGSTSTTSYEPYIPSVKMLADEVSTQKNDLSDLKDGTTPAAKALSDEDGNNIKSTYAKKTDLSTKANITDPVFTGSFSQNREAGSPIGTNSHAEGENTTASGNSSHAEGNGATAEGYASHAEGDGYAIGYESHAEGNASMAEGDKSHAEGTRSWGLGSNSHAEGYQTTASGSSSHSEGSSTNRISDITTDFSKETSISDIVTLRKNNKFSLAHGYGSHVEGINSLALGRSSHAEGENTIASDTCSHAEGYYTTASGRCSHAEGNTTIAAGDYQHVQGKYNVEDTDSAFIIGNGTDTSARSNAFSVKFTGVVKAASTITASTTADYAEFFEWLDGNTNNEDRVGYFVTLDGNRIKIASNNDDYILGIVSGEPFVLGNGDCDTWNGMYLHDEFRRTIYEPAPKVEEVEVKEEREETYIDEETGEEKIRTVEVVVGHEFKEVEGEFDGTRPKLNPDYDNTQPYVSRFDRKEWSPVGMLGVLAVRHDGTAKVNGYVTVNKNGIATACDRNTENSYRVIKANTDSVVEIIFK